MTNCALISFGIKEAVTSSQVLINDAINRDQGVVYFTHLNLKI